MKSDTYVMNEEEKKGKKKMIGVDGHYEGRTRDFGVS